MYFLINPINNSTSTTPEVHVHPEIKTPLSNFFNVTKYEDAKKMHWGFTAGKIIGLIGLNFVSLTMFAVHSALLRNAKIKATKGAKAAKTSKPATPPPKVEHLMHTPHSFYRGMSVKLGENAIVVAGMGHPKNNNENYNYSETKSIEGVIADLKERGFNEMISLDHQFKREMKNNWNDPDHVLHQIFVKDFNSLTLNQSLKILKIVKKQVQIIDT